MFMFSIVDSQGVFQAGLEVGIPILRTLIWVSPNERLPKILKYPTEQKISKLSGLEKSVCSAIFQALEWYPGHFLGRKVRPALEKRVRATIILAVNYFEPSKMSAHCNFVGPKLLQAFEKQVRPAILWTVNYFEPSKTSTHHNFLGR